MVVASTLKRKYGSVVQWKWRVYKYVAQTSNDLWILMDLLAGLMAM